jgi:hypothetical protein
MTISSKNAVVIPAEKNTIAIVVGDMMIGSIYGGYCVHTTIAPSNITAQKSPVRKTLSFLRQENIHTIIYYNYLIIS